MQMVGKNLGLNSEKTLITSNMPRAELCVTFVLVSFVDNFHTTIRSTLYQRSGEIKPWAVPFTAVLRAEKFPQFERVHRKYGRLVTYFRGNGSAVPGAGQREPCT